MTIFDFNRDGKTDSLEFAMGSAMIMDLMDEDELDDEYEFDEYDDDDDDDDEW